MGTMLGSVGNILMQVVRKCLLFTLRERRRRTTVLGGATARDAARVAPGEAIVRRSMLERKDAALAAKDAALSEKDTALSEKDAAIAALRAQLQALEAETPRDAFHAGDIERRKSERRATLSKLLQGTTN